MSEQKLYRMIATEAYVLGRPDQDTPGALVHWAPSKHAMTLCGWNMLYSKGLPREVGKDETLPACWRCEQKRWAAAHQV